MGRREEFHNPDNHHPPEVATLAWSGDALHRFDVTRSLIRLGFGPDCSHDLLVSFLSAKAQSSYMVQTRPWLAGRSLRFLSTLFEAAYYQFPGFREEYLDALFPS